MCYPSPAVAASARLNNCTLCATIGDGPWSVVDLSQVSPQIRRIKLTRTHEEAQRDSEASLTKTVLVPNTAYTVPVPGNSLISR